MTRLFVIFAAFMCGALSVARAPGADSPWFRTFQRGGVWWLGNQSKPRMWSFGLDCIGIGGPGPADNPHYDGRKIYGSDAAWLTDTTAKLKSWGINTLGGWSEEERFNNQFPYAEVLHLGSYDKAPWHDLWSAETTGFIEAAAADLIPKHANNPQLIGYFTDNELGWWDDTLFTTYFAFPATSPGKLKLIDGLRDHYKDDFTAFQNDWTTSASSFDSLKSQSAIYLKPGTTGIKAVHAFNFALASRYYKLMYDLVKKYDPNHLILGDRYCQYYNLETVRASKPYVDVVSTNAGMDWVDGTYAKFYFDSLHNLTGKPVMVTEFYLGAMENQTGNKNSGDAFPKVQTQAERAVAFRANLKELALKPYMVGAHWFQFADEPPKGRGDGEDWNMGIVDVYGQTYPLMVDALKSFDPIKAHQVDRKPLPASIPRAPQSPMTDNLKLWDRNRGYVRSQASEQFADLYLCHDGQNIYVGLVPMEYGDTKLYTGGTMPEIDRPQLSLRIGGWSGSVRYGFSAPATSSLGIESVVERPGLKHILAIKIPASSLGKTKLNAGEVLPISAELFSHGRGYRMTWNQSLKLN
jgi:hypothetical protein